MPKYILGDHEKRPVGGQRRIAGDGSSHFRLEEAIALETKLSQLRGRTLGAENPANISAMIDQAASLHKLRRREEACPLIEEAEAMEREIGKSPGG
ncbi:MAG: hypothetical protein P1U85_08710 [Verrucomicrobiales bacterium]|jgi:hypothetical protein|nr:hypothetical protein [Verrucomicrobiales bacterium]